MRFWLRPLKFIAYTLLFGSVAWAFLGSAYVLFFADPSQTAPGSLNAASPLGAKVAFLAFLIGVLIVGYLVNRIVWNRAERLP